MEDTVLFLDEKKRSFFCQIFRIVVAQFIISGEMRRGRGKFEKKRERQGGEGEREEESQSNHMIQWSIRNPKEGWSPLPPSPAILQIGASMVRKTGSHKSVLTYAPISSLRPLPGPLLWCRISRASLILMS